MTTPVYKTCPECGSKLVLREVREHYFDLRWEGDDRIESPFDEGVISRRVECDERCGWHQNEELK